MNALWELMTSGVSRRIGFFGSVIFWSRKTRTYRKRNVGIMKNSAGYPITIYWSKEPNRNRAEFCVKLLKAERGLTESRNSRDWSSVKQVWHTSQTVGKQSQTSKLRHLIPDCLRQRSTTFCVEKTVEFFRAQRTLWVSSKRSSLCSSVMVIGLNSAAYVIPLSVSARSQTGGNWH